VHPDPQDVNALTRRVIGAAIQVQRTLGPGLLESVYQQCLRIELRRRSLVVEAGRRVAIEYAGHRLPNALIIDLLVKGEVIVELKAVQELHPIHSVQVMTYLRLSGCPAALLINFNAPTVKQGLTRFDHPHLYSRSGKR
jgi:GxxExxY protein